MGIELAPHHPQGVEMEPSDPTQAIAKKRTLLTVFGAATLYAGVVMANTAAFIPDSRLSSVLGCLSIIPGLIGAAFLFKRSKLIPRDMITDLRFWLQEGRLVENQYYNRVTAANRIIECHQTKATTLDLKDLSLTSLPSCIGNLSQLESLDVSQNYLEELPVSIGNLNNLANFGYEGNPLPNQAEEQQAVAEPVNVRPITEYEAPKETACGICLVDFEEKESTLGHDKLAHLYHRACLKQWTDKKTTCPSCRANIEKLE